jgi:hypothetical protein
MNTIMFKLGQLLDRYICLEKKIQKLIYPLSKNYCSKCHGKCCSEQICKESTESVFLSMLVEKQSIQYDNRNGWLGTSGCRLDYGRPLVCYEFFCEDLLKSSFFKATNIQTIIHDFVSIGENAHGKSHLICLNDLNVLSLKKVKKMSMRVSLMLNMVANTRLDTNAFNNRKN